MPKDYYSKTPLILWPFVALWRFVATIIEMCGRLVAAIMGLVLIAVGVLVSLTVVGLIIGIPLIIFGVLLIVRGFF